MKASAYCGVAWRKSSYSGTGTNGNCVELASLPDGGVALRDSKHPGAGTVRLTQREFAAYLLAVKSGDLGAQV